ncbi:hypothetical protein RP20_CCG006011 [Aedes albopictus]|nr:hypothetical protein RP20_CCG006011 [Aedes albopictus]
MEQLRKRLDAATLAILEGIIIYLRKIGLGKRFACESVVCSSVRSEFSTAEAEAAFWYNRGNRIHRK